MIKDKLTINEVMHLKRLGMNGLLLARTRYPNLDAEELAELEKIIRLHRPTDPPATAFSYDEHRHMFICAAWLLGAAQSQLGRKMRIAQQTVCRHLDKGFRDIPDRKAIRIHLPTMPASRLDTLFETFYGMCKLEPTWYKQMTPLELASVMEHFPDNFIPDTDTSEGDYAELPDQTRKLASEA